MKKYIAFLLCIITIISMVSCDFDKEHNDIQTSNSSTTDDNPSNESEKKDNITSQSSENDIAMQMYAAAIGDEICVIDERLGEIKLKACRVPSNNNLRLDECKLLTKAILDLDGDGVDEYVIKSSDYDHTVLHYYNGKVYSYGFYINHLNTDGTFYWSDSSVAGNWEGGLDKIIFDGETLIKKNIYRLKYPERSVINYYETDCYEFYINGEVVTKADFFDFDLYRTNMIFTPFEWSISYPITAEQAWNLANAYWKNIDGSHDGAAGTLVVYKVVLLDVPIPNTNYYRIALQGEFFSNFDIRKDCNPPQEIRLYEQLIVNAFTGEVSKYDNISSQPSKNEIAMQMYEAVLDCDIKVYDTDLKRFIYLKDCKTPYNQIPLDELDYLKYAYTDMDSDSINELIIDCGDTLILRYYEGTVYLYSFTFRNLYYLNTDGTYAWNHTGQNFEYGEKQLVFDGAEIKTNELYRIVNDGEPNAEYYLDGYQVTKEEILKYTEDNSKTRIRFLALEVSWNANTPYSKG